MSKKSARHSERGNRLAIDAGFFPAWLVTFIATYCLSYFWHGVLLNDLTRITYPINLFLLLVAIIYFVIAFMITYLVKVLTTKDGDWIRGALIGGFVGGFIYLIAFVFGISFLTDPSIEHIALDAFWQIAEEGFAGIIATLVLAISAQWSAQKTN